MCVVKQKYAVNQLKKLPVEAVSAVVGAGDTKNFLICDIRCTNRSVYSNREGPESYQVLSV